MNEVKLDPLIAALGEVRAALDADDRRRETQWTDNVHAALGKMAAAIQHEVQGAEKSMDTIGAINPDFHHAPGTERQIQTARAELIQLGERVHQMRADLRKGLDAAEVRRTGEVLATAVEKARRAESELLFATLNSNPGAGD
jgi:hypothetical protein